MDLLLKCQLIWPGINCIFIVSVDLFTTMIDLFRVLAAMLDYPVKFWNFIPLGWFRENFRMWF